MGAEFDYDIIRDKDRKLSDKQIKQEVKEICEHRAYRFGHEGYTGTLAEKIISKIFIYRRRFLSDEKEAEEIIMDISDKWGDVHAFYIKNKGWFFGSLCSS